jgi:cell wall-associated NlpC family hydrolase
MGKVHFGLERGFWVVLLFGAILALVTGRYEYCWSETEQISTAETLSGDKEGEVVLSSNYASQRSDSQQSLSECYDEKSLTHDFAERDRLPKTQDLRSPKMSLRWGPRAFKYPTVVVPKGCDPVKWKRLRVIAVAKRYIGLPYRHHHVPDWVPVNGDGPGLDCSNFTSWVYNYGLGIRFSSDILAQSDGLRAPGRKVNSGESFEPGDLLFITKKDGSRVSHVVIFCDTDHIVDSHGSGVQVRTFEGWYKSHFSHARRIIE